MNQSMCSFSTMNIFPHMSTAFMVKSVLNYMWPYFTCSLTHISMITHVHWIYICTFTRDVVFEHSSYPAGFHTQDTSYRWGGGGASYRLVDSRCCEPPSGSCSQSSGSSSCILLPPAWCCCHTLNRSCSGRARPTPTEPEPQLLQDEEREQRLFTLLILNYLIKYGVV